MESNTAEEAGLLWPQGLTKKYVPSAGDFVVGVVVARLVDGFRVDVGSAHPAFLPALEFEGATKRNKPSLAVGAAVFARVAEVDRDLDAALSCTDTTGKAGGFGELSDGTIVRTSQRSAQQLLGGEVLQAVAQQVRFEVAVGLNGAVWVRAETPRDTLVVVHAVNALR